MKTRISMLFIICLFVAMPVYAQDPTETPAETPAVTPTEPVSTTTTSTPSTAPAANEEVAPSGDTALMAGTKSLIFSFGAFANGGLTSGAFLAVSPDGNMEPDATMAQYGVGGRYYISDQMAVRGAFQFQTTTRDAEGNEDSYTMFGLGAGIQYHFVTSGKVSVFGGGMLGFYKGTLEEEGQDDTDVTGFGLYGILGAEYYINRSLSFGAEYILGFTSTSAETGDFEIDFTDVSVHTYSFYFAFHF